MHTWPQLWAESHLVSNLSVNWPAYFYYSINNNNNNNNATPLIFATINLKRSLTFQSSLDLLGLKLDESFQVSCG